MRPGGSRLGASITLCETNRQPCESRGAYVNGTAFEKSAAELWGIGCQNRRLPHNHLSRYGGACLSFPALRGDHGQARLRDARDERSADYGGGGGRTAAPPALFFLFF